MDRPKRGTPEWREKISKSLKGRTVWNKGLKGVCRPNSGSFKKGTTPWNKGKTYELPHTRGKVITPEQIAKANATKRKNRHLHKYRKGESNPNWSGDNVGYFGVHKWLIKNFIKSEVCENCGSKPGLTKNGKPKIHWSNKSGKYLRDRNDWQQLCISCHWKHDGLVKNFKKSS